MKPNNFPLRPNLNGSEELYTQTNDIPQKFSLEAAKEFIINPTDIIYEDLYETVVNGKLIPNQWYRLTNYKSVNYLNGILNAYNPPVPIDPNFNPFEVYEGETEILLLQAITNYEISPIGYSETFKGDIIQYEPFTNSIGINLDIYNGNTLPNSSTVLGFDLKWDGANVYFDMPIDYPANFGHYFSIYAEFSGGTYFQEGVFEPLTPNISTAQTSYTSDDIDFNYPKKMSKIKVENNGSRIILLDLDYNDFLNYDLDTLNVGSTQNNYKCYGWITRRIDTYRNIDVPFDFRGRKYRRFEVDLSAINTDLGIGYWGIGDNHLGQGTTGNYKDFKCFGEDGFDAFNIQWEGLGGPDLLGNKGINDNVVFLGGFINNKIKDYFIYNTFGHSFVSNIIGESFLNTVGFGFQNNTIGNNFAFNTIGNNFYKNTIKDGFNSNTILSIFQLNDIGYDFEDNTIGTYFNGNVIGNFFNNNSIADNFGYVGGVIYGNKIGNNFMSNNIGANVFNNLISNNFTGNTIGSSFNNNEINKNFEDNTIGNKFANNVSNGIISSCIIGNEFRVNKIDSPLLGGLDFSLSTHVYTVYNCRIFTSNDNNLYLEYFNITTPMYVSPTT